MELDSQNFEEFTSQVSKGYSEAMLLAMKSKTFSGNMIFNENNQTFEFNDTVLAKCRSYIEQISSNEIAQTVVKAMSGNGISPSFTHCGKQIEMNVNQNPTSNIPKEKLKKKKWWQLGK